MPEWDAQIEVGDQLARELITAQFPRLDTSTLRHIGEGWDNTVWATADDVAFRFPRRTVALAGIRREMAVLPGLAARLPAPIPDAAFCGEPTAGFPWPWFGSRLIAGTEIPDAAPSADGRTALAEDVARFLSALHALPPPAVALPCDPNRRADMADRLPRTRAALQGIADQWPRAREAEPILRAAERLAPGTEQTLVHGDLHLRHLLVDADGRLAGVIDWGDVCLAPRAIDLSLYWSLFSATERAAFSAIYGEVDPDGLLRARVLAVFFGATLAAYAIDKGWDALAREALAGLDRTLSQ